MLIHYHVNVDKDTTDLGEDYVCNICKNKISINENETFLTYCGNLNGYGQHKDGIFICYDCLVTKYKKKKGKNGENEN